MKHVIVLLCVGLLQACGSKTDASFGGSGSPVETDPNATTGSSGTSTTDTGATEPDTGSSSEDTGVSGGGESTSGDGSGGDASGGEGSSGDESGGETSGGAGSGDDGGGGLSAIGVTSFTVTACDGSEGETSADITYDETAGHVRVKHDAHLANCCAEFSLTATASESGDVSIVYDEGDALCDCVCLVNLRYNIVGLPSGNWNIQIPDGLGDSVTVP